MKPPINSDTRINSVCMSRFYPINRFFINNLLKFILYTFGYDGKKTSESEAPCHALRWLGSSFIIIKMHDVQMFQQMHFAAIKIEKKKNKLVLKTPRVNQSKSEVHRKSSNFLFSFYTLHICIWFFFFLAVAGRTFFSSHYRTILVACFALLCIAMYTYPGRPFIYNIII